MNAPDIRISTTLARHRKFRRFKRDVGDGAMEYLIRLWCEVAEQAPSGDLTGWTDGDIADAAGYPGDPMLLASSLHAAGMLDGMPGAWKVHDWHEHQAYVCRAPARIEQAKKAASARWKCPEHAQGMPAVMPPSPPFPSPPFPSPSPRSKPTPPSPSEMVPPAAKTAPRARLASKPEDVSDGTWADFQALRRQKRAPLTETALRGIRREAGKAGVTLEAALGVCCERGWQGFRADWYQSNNGTGQKKDMTAMDWAERARQLEEAGR